MVKLRQDHTCKCRACIEIPQLFQQGKDLSALRDEHTCGGCLACIANINSLVDTGAIVLSELDHTCACDACSENQEVLASS